MRASAALLVFIAVVGSAVTTNAQGGGRAGDVPPLTPRAAAPIDLTGYWVSVVSEDWRYRMVTPAKGDYQSVPMTPAAVKVADAWDPEADTAAGLQCKSYGAGIIMRVPGRLHVTWQDEETLHIEADAGTQTRVLRFRTGAGERPARSWQGDSTAQWQTPRAARGRGAAGTARAGGAATPPREGSLKVVTTNLRSGYLRKNGIPYSENATVTEYYSLARLREGYEILVVTTVVEDPMFLTQPFIVSSQFKKQPDAAGWDPTPCSATW